MLKLIEYNICPLRCLTDIIQENKHYHLSNHNESRQLLLHVYTVNLVQLVH